MTKCEYFIESQVLMGPEAICNSYKQNMIAGRKKFDVLEWGKSRIEDLGDSEFYVHFTDYLTHKGKKHTHKCKQKLSIDEHHKIYKIEHINNPIEQNNLKGFYKSVGIE